MKAAFVALGLASVAFAQVSIPCLHLRILCPFLDFHSGSSFGIPSGGCYSSSLRESLRMMHVKRAALGYKPVVVISNADGAYWASIGTTLQDYSTIRMVYSDTIFGQC